jgi:phosphoserine phosphatase RsbU/P
MMAKRFPLTPEQRIAQLEADLAEKERELISFKTELTKINDELEKFINQIGSELKLASLIQRSLVPTDIPTIPGFAFSTKYVPGNSGGDYFDVFELEDKMRFGLLMASSTGHGMASLFMSVLLKLTTQIEARKGMEPADVLTHMTKEIQNSVKENDRAHIFYAVADRRRYEMAFVRAGEIPAFLYKYGDDKLVRLVSDDEAIGKNTKPKFNVETVTLEPRDRLVVCSRGIINATSETNEKFGMDRLTDVLVKNILQSGAHEIRNEVLFQVSKFAEGRDYPQDLSVLVMQVKDKVIKLRKG